MKYFLLFIVASMIGLGGVYYVHNQYEAPVETKTTLRPTRTPSPTLFSTKNPPSESLTGTLDTFLGTVTWEPRDATESSPIHSLAVMKQGDSIETGEDGTATIVFNTATTITIEENSYVHIVQTLPANIVFSQNKGAITYERTGNTPVTVRVLSLIIDLDEKSVMRIAVDEETETVVITAEQGKGVAAYNDTDFETVKLTLSEDETLTFDNQLRESAIK